MRRFPRGDSGPLVVCALMLAGCGDPGGGGSPGWSVVLPVDGDVSPVADGSDGVGPEAFTLDAGPSLDTELRSDGTNEPEPGCPEDVVCVDDLPFTWFGDTSTLAAGSLDAYDCAESIDESGPERVFRVVVTEDAFLSAAVYDAAGVDVDVHILSALDPAACVDRGHHGARADVGPGVWYVVVDTWVDGAGLARSGPYQLDIGVTVPSRGPCTMSEGIMERVGDGGDHLVMPATGSMVMEAHLVTQEEPPPYPATSTEFLDLHYGLSQDTTGFVMYRTQAWAPLEGGSFYGCGIGSPTVFPVRHEAWYVNMYWTSSSRPAKGTRMILRLPDTPYAVVVAAGYETGPGNLAHIGGTPEEPHYYLGTGHTSTLTLGIASDQALPYGPRVCD